MGQFYFCGQLVRLLWWTSLTLAVSLLDSLASVNLDTGAGLLFMSYLDSDLDWSDTLMDASEKLMEWDNLLILHDTFHRFRIKTIFCKGIGNQPSIKENKASTWVRLQHSRGILMHVVGAWNARLSLFPTGVCIWHGVKRIKYKSRHRNTQLRHHCWDIADLEESAWDTRILPASEKYKQYNRISLSTNSINLFLCIFVKASRQLVKLSHF